MAGQAVRAAVAVDTVAFVKKFIHKNPAYVRAAVDKTATFDVRTLPDPPLPPTATSAKLVEVVNGDTLDVVVRLKKERDWKPLVLNMASDFVPGGGWLKGSSAQEEQLFLRTALHAHLGSALVPKNQRRHPKGPYDIVYSPNVAVFRHGEEQKYVMMDDDERFLCSFVSVAAIRNPHVKNETYATVDDQKLMQQKIDAIFRLAIDKGYTSLVLGALGCGAFANPPKAVAAMFADAIKRYGHCFTKGGICFAVYDPHPHHNSNSAIFSSILV
jgi:uncharacterized protein (TIGR02452 family)